MEYENNGFSRVYADSIPQNVQVYENEISGEKYVIFDETLFSNEDSVVVYENEETGEKVEISIVDHNDNSRGIFEEIGDWSEGTIPAGARSYRVEVSTPLIIVHYNVEVEAYPVVMHGIYNAGIGTFGYTIQEEEARIERSAATSSFPARATYEFRTSMTQAGIVLESVQGYVTYEINYYGQCRASWRVW